MSTIYNQRAPHPRAALDKFRREQKSETPYIARRTRATPRNFLLKWNNAHVNTAYRDRYTWRECWGTLYPNGRVVLDFGEPFASLNDLKDHVAQAGIYLIQWLEADEVEDE